MIKLAYRSLARQFHPDKIHMAHQQGGAGGAGGAGVFTDEEFDARVKEFEEKFKIIGAAYDALMQGKNHIT